MRLKLRKRRARRLSYRRNWKSYLKARTKVRLPLLFLQPSSALRSLFKAAPVSGNSARSTFAWLFLLALRLPTGLARAIAAAAHLRMFPSHLSVTPHLRIMRHLIHRPRPVSSPTCSSCFAGVHLGLVSASRSWSSCLDLIPGVA